MGFDFDKYDTGGGAYIGAAEKKAIAEAGIPFVITAVREEQENRFDQPRYVVSVTVPNPESGDDEERLLSFPIGSGVDSRDRMLDGLKAYLEGDAAEEVKAKLEKVGRSYIIRQA
jgi:hypothetical protein